MTRVTWNRTISMMAIATLFTVGVASSASAQNAVVTGRVMSDRGQPLYGANVYITELNISVGTNEAGNYTINIPAARVSGQSVALRARAVGFRPESQPITVSAGTQTVNFDLDTDIARLSEVVVTGVTAETQQIKLPFTVARVDTSQMPVTASNPLTQLQGKIPGASIVSASGRPGESPAVVLRGPVSINGTGRSQNPLFIIDGVVLQGDLPDINPNDIESVEVVKGAAAASLYGARAGAGVINITTKTGKNAPEGLRFGIRSEFGAGDIEREYPLATTHFLSMDPRGQLFCSNESVGGSPCARYINLYDEVNRINDQGEDFSLPPQRIRNDGGIAQAPTYDQLTGTFQVNPWPTITDPVAQVVTPSAFANTNLDLRGRVGTTGVYASISNLTQQGAVKFLNGYTRNSARVNLDHSFNDRLTASMTTYYSQSKEDAAHLDQTTGQIWFNLSRMPWYVNLTQRDQFGRLYIRPNVLNQGEQNFNPLYAAENNKREDRGTRFLGGLTMRYNPLEWVTLDGNFSYDRSTGNFTQFRDRGYRVTASNPTFSAGFINEGAFDTEAYNTSFSATARRTLLPDLAATFTARTVYAQSTASQDSLQGADIIVPGLETADAAQLNFLISSANQTIRELAFYGGADLDYKDRYILGGVIRRDGSSLFGEGNRWATFGRVSAAWIASLEPWWPLAEQLSLFKLRASRGTTGQRPSFAAQYETFTIGTGGTLNPATLGNKDLKPEINTETEVGADIEFFGRAVLNVSYAHSVIDDQILSVRPPTATGFQLQWQNAGQLTNKTWEAALTVPILNGRDFTWSTRLIWDRTRSQITRLDAPPFTGVYHPAAIGQNPFSIYNFREGEMLGTFYGQDFVRSCAQLPAAFRSDCGGATSAFRPNDQGYIVWVGQGNQLNEGITKNLWRTQLTSGPWGAVSNWGMPIVLRDSTGNIATVPLGNGIPDYHIGISQNFSYKKFTAYALLDGAFGQEVWNIGYHWSLGDFMTADQNQVGKSVETAKPIGYWWRRGSAPVGGSSGVGGFYDALNPNSFSVEDGSYMKLREVTVNYHLGDVGGVGDFTIGVIGRNLKTWTDFRGFDPEVGVGDAQGRTGPLNSAALSAVAGYRFPNLRTYTFRISTSF